MVASAPKVRVRFAPSPTGPLHVGGARTALFNFLFARAHGGSFIVRIDDTDRERSNAEHEVDIVDGLEWLGLYWDEGPGRDGDYGPYRQSERIDKHRHSAHELLQSGVAYKDREGTVRLRYQSPEVVVQDLVCGECRFLASALGPEPVLLRADDTPTYHLATVCDDIEMKITHIIRGQDHLTNTAKHQLLFQALGSPPPKFAHLPLILGRDGSKLSKRDSTSLVSLREFRAAGYLPEALVNFLLLLGWSHPEAKEQISLEQAIGSFSLERVGKTGAIFDAAKLKWLNGWWIRALSVERLVEESRQFLGEYADSLLGPRIAYWHDALSVLRDGISNLVDCRDLAQMLIGEELVLSEEVGGFVASFGVKQIENILRAWQEALHEFPTEEDRECYTKEQMTQIISLLKKKLGISGKELFQAIRVAIIGQVSGPELKLIVPLIKRTLLAERASEALEKVVKLI